jgi:hypothetical protein
MFSRNEKLEEKLYEQVAQEIQNNRINQGLWLKANVDSGGDEFKAKALYTRYRVKQLLREVEEAQANLNQQSAKESEHRPAESSQSIDKVASGQKLIIYAILAQFLTVGLQAVFGDIAGLVGLVAVVMSLVGMFRLSSGLGYSLGAKILFVVLLLIPLVGLITLLVLNSNATDALRKAGFQVGLLGARR